MKLTIIREDNTVYKDGISYSNLDLSNIPTNIHALQFNDSVNVGWIEFSENDFGIKEANENITSLPSWAETAITQWNEAQVAEETRKSLEAAEDQPVTTGTTTI